MAGYAQGRKPKMDARTWINNFKALEFNRPDMDPRDYRQQVEELCRLAQGHFYPDFDYVAINRKLSGTLADQGRALARLACHRLYDVATDSRTITMAIRDAALHAGSNTPGVDGRTIEYYRGTVKDFKWAHGIRDLLKGDDYAPEPLRMTSIPKKSGGRRKLAIPTIEDRVVQRAIKLAVEPYLDKLFMPTSFGFRKRLNRLDALATAMLMADKLAAPWVVAVDIKDAFPSTSKARLMQTMRKYLHGGKICDLVDNVFSQAGK